MATAATVSTDCEPSLRNIVEQSSLKWVFVGGKGGVGKTTTSCSLAIQLSRVRENVLLVSMDPAHSLSDAFGQEFSTEPQLVDGFTNLYAMEQKLNFEQDEKFKMPANPTDEDAFVKMMYDAMPIPEGFPGISAMVGLMGILNLVQSSKYSVVVFDTAPTGHTLQFIGMPLLLEKCTQESEVFRLMTFLMQQVPRMFGASRRDMEDNIFKRFRNVVDHMRDQQKTTFVSVCIAEFLSLYETERLIQQLMKLGIDTHNVVVNQLYFPQADGQSCSLCSFRRKMQKKYLEQIETLYQDVHVTKLPLLNDEVRGVDMLEPFSEYLLHPYTPRHHPDIPRHHPDTPRLYADTPRHHPDTPVLRKSRLELDPSPF